MRPVLVLSLLLAVPAALAEGVTTAEEGVSAELVYEGLEQPVDFAFGPDGALYYVEFMTGNLRVVPPGATQPDPEPLWTAPDLQTGGERGLVGLALDPEFEETRAFYVYYQHNESGEVTSRLSKVVDGEETVLLGGLRAGLLHNSGRIAFLPDGTLLVSVGDAILDTAGREAAKHAHDETSLNGKILRLHRDGTVPDDNPWGNEVWSKGHRNVYGLAVSPEGVVMATENGPEIGDEVNRIEPGRDYGWPTCAGPCDDDRYADPLLSYSPTIAPTGAAWYAGHFYFSDFNTGRLRRVVELENGSHAEQRVLQLDKPRILDLETAQDGLWFSTWDGVWHVTLPAEAPPLPTTPDGAVDPTEPTPATPEPGADIGGGARGVPAPGVALVLLAMAGATWGGRRARLRFK